MRLNRAYIDAPLAPGQRVRLTDAVSGHLVRVLRLREGDGCVLFNGDGHDYCARIVRADKRAGEVEITARQAVHTESALQLWLIQGIARGEKMDLIVQKATELGVSGIIPLISERSEVKLDGPRAEKRLAHWQHVIIAACEQSGRARIPALLAPQPLAQCAAALPGTRTRWLLDPEATDTLACVHATPGDPIILAIGPEGGWSPRDRQILAGMDFTALRLGPRILRTETAGLTAIAGVQMRFGDI